MKLFPVALAASILCALPSAQSCLAADVLPASDSRSAREFPFSVKDASPMWPKPSRPPPDAPNIIVILLDDVGFADTSTFGGAPVTPELDKLAATGLRYNNFHTTGTCSPTRAALLAGRNAHRVGFGLAEIAGGFPGYNFIWKQSTATVAEVLRQSGYSTAAFGKWHNTPYMELSPVGPFDRWPTGLGFEYFYGFQGSRDNQWTPSLYRNTTAVEPPRTPQQGYHLTADLVDDAIKWLQTQESLMPGRPYFLYFAPGAAHEPHHAPQEWIDRYRGRFDQGWDRLRQEIFVRQQRLGVVPPDAHLTARPKEIPAWNELSLDQQKLYARQMEVYAGFVSHTDHEIGRLLKAARTLPSGDNTLILYIVGDNGSAAEGGLDGRTEGHRSIVQQLSYVDRLGSAAVASNTYSLGWAWVGSTPFQWWKGVGSHFGATRNPLVLSWPARITDHGGVRSQFSHVNDVAPTIYELTGIPFPTVVNGVTQQPLDGVSFAGTLDSSRKPSSHHIQYFESWGNRAIYRDGWIAAARHLAVGVNLRFPLDFDYANDRWELYRANDFSQAHDVAVEYPEKLKQLRDLFDQQARANDVYPLGGALPALGSIEGNIPLLTDDRRTFVYYAGMPRLHKDVLPSLSGKSFSLTADVVIPASGAEGVLLSYGGDSNGFVLYAHGDRLIFEDNHRTGPRYLLESTLPLPRGEVILSFEFATQVDGRAREGAVVDHGIGRLLINGRPAGEARLPTERACGWWTCSLGVGRTFGAPVSTNFTAPFEFTGTLTKVQLDLH